MIAGVIRRGAAALLVLGLSACVEASPSRDAAPAVWVAPTVTYRLLDDICDRLDHSWLIQLTGASPEITYSEPWPDVMEFRQCQVRAAAPGGSTEVSVQVTAGLKPSESAELEPSESADPEPSESADPEFPMVSEPLDGVGEMAFFMLDRSDLRTGPGMEFRRDLVLARDGPIVVNVIIRVSDSPLPDESAIKATLATYVKRVLELVVGEK